jgi:hypothetical protein
LNRAARLCVDWNRLERLATQVRLCIPRKPVVVMVRELMDVMRCTSGTRESGVAC